MAIIQIIITAYVTLTLPLVAYVAYAFWKHYQGKGTDKVADHGQKQIVDLIVNVHNDLVAWLGQLKLQQDVAKQDHDAMLEVTRAVARSMIDIKELAVAFSAARAPQEKNKKDFIYTLQYAHDHFAKSKGQRDAISGIINIIEKNYHGAESK